MGLSTQNHHSAQSFRIINNMMKIILAMGVLLAVCNGLPKAHPQDCFPFCGVTNTQNCQGSQCNISNNGGGSGGGGGVSNTQNCRGSQCNISNGAGGDGGNAFAGFGTFNPSFNTLNCQGSQCAVQNSGRRKRAVEAMKKFQK